MKLCFIYVFGDIFRNKKQNIALFLAVILAITMVSVAAISMESKKAADIYFIGKLSGNYLISGQNLSRDEMAAILSDPSFGEIVYHRTVNFSCGVINKEISDTESKIFKAAESLIAEGRAPEKGEILLCSDYISYFGIGLSVGDTVELQFTSTDFESFVISGFYQPDDNWIWVNLDNVIVSKADFERLVSKYPALENYTMFSFKPKGSIDGLVRKYQKMDIWLSSNNSYIEANKGTILFLPFLILFICIFIAGSAIIICMNQVAIKKQAKNFAILSMLGCGSEIFNKIILLKTFLTAVLCIPVSIIIASVLLYFIFGNDPELFILTINPFTVAVICILSATLIYISTYIPLRISEKKETYAYYRQAKDFDKENLKKTHFSSWYLNRFMAAEKQRIKMLILATVACFTGIIFLFYNYSINSETKSMFGESYEFCLNKSASMFTVEKPYFDKKTYEEILKIPGVKKVLKEAHYLRTLDGGFQENKNNFEIITHSLSGKKVLEDIKEKEYKWNNLNFKRADLIYRDMSFMESARKFVVEGDFECIYKENGYVMIIDDNWSENNPNSFHVGDEIVFEKMFYNMDTDEYRKSNEEKVTLTVGAIIKSKYSKYFRGSSSFPIFVNAEDYEKITGKGAMNSLFIFAEHPENEVLVNSLYKEIEKLLPIESFQIFNNYENKIWTHKLKTVFNMIIIILNIFIIISICFILWLFNYYYIEKRRDELNILYKIGVPRKKLFSMFLFEGAIYGAISTVAAAVAGYIISFIMYSLIGMNPILEPWDFPIIIIIGCGSLCLAANIISIIVPFQMLHKKISGTKNGGKINV